MKTIFLLFICLFIGVMLQAQVSKTIEITAGNLKSVLTTEELTTITNLSLTGTIDARDFKTMRDDMPALSSIDLSGASIVEYFGYEGSGETNLYSYPADEIPQNAFCNLSDVGKASLTSVIFPSSIQSFGKWAFFDCISLGPVSIPSTVKSIGYSAFNRCAAITSITFESPSSLQVIGPYAFYRCLGLSLVNIPSTVTIIDKYAFLGCTNLSSVTFDSPSSLNTIGLYAFRECNLLTSFVVPAPVSVIDYGAFFECVNLSSLEFESQSTLTTIGTYAFGFCSGLSSFTIFRSVISIGDVVFLGTNVSATVDSENPNYSGSGGVLYDKDQTRLMYCPTVKSGIFELPSTVKNIATDAFYNCQSLTQILLPSGLEIIDDWAFENCTGLTTVSIPSLVRSIGSEAFYNCSGLTSIIAMPAVPIDLSYKVDVFYQVDKTNCTLNVPYGSKEQYAAAYQWQDFTNIVETTEGIRVNPHEVYLAAEEGSKDTVNITANVPWTATSDQDWLTIDPISGSSNEAVTLIAHANPLHTYRKATVILSATGLDSQIVYVTQAESSLPIVVNAGELKTSLSAEELATITKLTLTGTIDARDFKTMRDDMPNVAEIDLSEVKVAAYTGKDGTWWDSSILSVYPANEIPANAFFVDGTGGKMSLISFIFPKSVTSIGGSAFHSCINLMLQLPSTIKDIAGSAFSGCFFPSVTIPSSVISIGVGAFGNAYYITVDIANLNYSSIDGVLFNKSKSTLVQCPFLIQGSYTIPSSVKVIGEFAFHWCQNLSSISIPSSVNSICNYAFSNCGSLKSIYNYAKLPLDLSSSYNVFEGTDKTICTLYVPYGSKALYASANQWSGFTTIVEMPGLQVSVAKVSVKSKQGSTDEINISSNTTWSASSDQPWLALNKTSGTGAETLTFTAEENPVNAIRTATVTVSAEGVEPQTITVTQEAWPTGLNDLANNSIQLKCYPNPFSDEIILEIQNPKHTETTVDIYNLLGERIRNLVVKRTDEKLDLKWNGTNDLGQKVAPGVYVCKVNNQSKQVILLK